MSVEQIQDRVEIFDFGEGSYTDIKLVFLTPKNYLGQQCLVGGAKTFLFRELFVLCRKCKLQKNFSE